MAKEYFPEIGQIKYEGSESKNPMAFHYYDAERVVAGKKMKEEMEAMKHITIVEPIVTVESAVKAKTIEDLKVLADALLA